jgi:DNA-binding MarR family transcriptional regulator
VPGDRRKVLVRLTESGLDVVDEVVGGHLDTERELLQSLTPSQQATLERLLRTALIGLGDRPVRPTSTRSPASSE